MRNHTSTPDVVCDSPYGTTGQSEQHDPSIWITLELVNHTLSVFLGHFSVEANVGYGMLF